MLIPNGTVNATDMTCIILRLKYMKGVTANPFVVVLSVPVCTKVELMLYIFQKHEEIHCSYLIVIKVEHY